VSKCRSVEVSKCRSVEVSKCRSVEVCYIIGLSQLLSVKSAPTFWIYKDMPSDSMNNNPAVLNTGIT